MTGLPRLAATLACTSATLLTGCAATAGPASTPSTMSTCAEGAGARCTTSVPVIRLNQSHRIARLGLSIDPAGDSQPAVNPGQALEIRRHDSAWDEGTLTLYLGKVTTVAGTTDPASPGSSVTPLADHQLAYLVTREGYTCVPSGGPAHGPGQTPATIAPRPCSDITVIDAVTGQIVWMSGGSDPSFPELHEG